MQGPKWGLYHQDCKSVLDTTSGAICSNFRISKFLQNPRNFSEVPLWALARPYPQCGWDFPEEMLAKFREDPETLSELFSKGFKASRAFPEFCPLSRHGRLLLSELVPERAGHGIPSSTEGISEVVCNVKHGDSTIP